MPKLVDRAREEGAAALLRPSPELAELIRTGFERVKNEPAAARQFFDLVNSLPGRSASEQEAIVEQALRALP